MYARTFWQQRLLSALQRKSVVWLTSVRRAGKTSLCQSLPEVEYFDCELPRVRREMEDPEAFLQRLEGRRVVLDEIRRLSNPSELLKIAADRFLTPFLCGHVSLLPMDAPVRQEGQDRSSQVDKTLR
jgi:predicted AAA+ superfamily ATPase